MAPWWIAAGFFCVCKFHEDIHHTHTTCRYDISTANNNKNKTKAFFVPRKKCAIITTWWIFLNKKNGPNTFPPKTNVHPKTSDSFLPHSHQVESMESESLSPWSIAWRGSAASKNCARVVAVPRWPEALTFEPQRVGGRSCQDSDTWIITMV